tara:strand:+ start:308 stop:580 length:273 start_codon:yes stop_codon:yes gene_type:complete
MFTLFVNGFVRRFGYVGKRLNRFSQPMAISRTDINQQLSGIKRRKKIMPKVGTGKNARHFAYTPAGMKKAKIYKNKLKNKNKKPAKKRKA